MSTITSPPAELDQDQRVLAPRGAVVARFETNDEAQLLRVDAGLASRDSEFPEAALAVLANSAVAELRFLRVDTTEEEIYLSGKVRSFYHKQLAQEAMRPIAKGRLVINQVQVQE